MKSKPLLWCAAGLLVALTQASASTLYVDAASTNAVPPFTTWANAAANIQDAVDAAVAGDEIVVTNGVYQTGARAVYGMNNRVAVTKAVTVRSVNGPEVTSIVGHGPIGENAIRCAYLTNGAVLAGFTLTNGATQTVDDWEVSSITNSGGGVWCEFQSVVVTNCMFAGNSAGAGGGAFGGTLNNCVLTGNSAWDSAGGGGAYASKLNNCIVTGNSAWWGGGGATWSTLNNCLLTGNSGGDEGGGGAAGGTLNNCTLIGNSASYGGGAVAATLNNCLVASNSVSGEASVGGGALSCTLNNCTLTGNTADDGGGAYFCTLNNCTVTENSAQYSGGGTIGGTLNNCTVTGNSAANGGGVFAGTLNNCLVYFNIADNAPNWSQNQFYSIALNYSCTTPAPESGVGNITDAPLFVDTNGWSNLRLQSNSPCINAGNNAFVTTGTDLDGRPRVVGGTVDIGAYEWQGAIRYVSAASTNPIAPYSSWASAAVTIQDAVDAAVDGEEIVVTNGVYQTGARAVYGMSNRVAVTKAVIVRSVNGPDYTSIVGNGQIRENAIRCAYLTNGAVLSGFTLTNGATQTSGQGHTNRSGGGAWCEGLNAVLTNCVVTRCYGYWGGGGVFSGTLYDCTLTDNITLNGGGAHSSTLNNCTLTNNGASDGGGAAQCVLNDCTLAGNSAETGGGASDCALVNSTLSGNTAFYGGGAFGGAMSNCVLRGNWTHNLWYFDSYGGGAYGSSLNNCLVIGNSARDEIGGGGGVYSSTLTNCTLIGNSAPEGGGAMNSTLNNCIVYYNSEFELDDDDRRFEISNNYNSSTFNNSCTTPAPESGVGNITNAPLFVDTNGWSNLRLQFNSPCINAGHNAYLTAATDLDGLPRLVGGTVDIGAYEFQSPASTISYAWLQQSGLPTDGSADAVDTDHDGHNNWQEWMAGTDPTNVLSALRLAAPVITPTNITLTWTSVTNRTYTLEQATNLGGAPAFSVLRSNLVGLPGTTSWTDTNAPVSSPRFYQLRVSP